MNQTKRTDMEPVTLDFSLEPPLATVGEAMEYYGWSAQEFEFMTLGQVEVARKLVPTGYAVSVNVFNGEIDSIVRTVGKQWEEGRE